MIRTISITIIVLLLLTAASAIARQKPMEIIFEAGDTDHNGLISEDEWHAAMQKRFDALDKNHDNAVSYDEFQKAKETLRERFRARMQNDNSEP